MVVSLLSLRDLIILFITPPVKIRELEHESYGLCTSLRTIERCKDKGKGLVYGMVYWERDRQLVYGIRSEEGNKVFVNLLTIFKGLQGTSYKDFLNPYCPLAL